MKTPNLLIIIVLTCVFYSCGKNNTSPSQQSLILGTWKLQQQHLILTKNGIKQIDTTVNTSSANSGNVNFSVDGTFTSSGYYNTPIVNGHFTGPPEAAADSTSGTYSFAGNQFNMTNGVSGFIFGVFYTISGSPVLYGPKSYTTKISQLSQSALTIQTDYLSNETSPAQVAYETVNTFYFTR
jgi:hypothetical protein